MNPHKAVPGGSLRLLALILPILLAIAPDPVAAADVDFDPARVGWSEIRMTASKLFLTAEARLALRTVPGVTVRSELHSIVHDGFTPLASGTDVLELVYDARGAGNRTRLTLLMDPTSGAAIQSTRHTPQGKLRLRTYRFGQEGVYQQTRWPATASENALLPTLWTRTSEGLRTYPISPGKQPVVETAGLLYAIAAAPLYRPGDVIEVLVFRRRDTQTVRIEVLPPREINVRYAEQRLTETVPRSGKVWPLRLSLQGLPVPGGNPKDDDLELLGLRGRLELLLDPATRAPLELSGNVKVLGAVTLRLADLRPR